MIRLEYRGNPDFADQCAFQTAWSSGCDLVVQEDTLIGRGEVVILPTGLYIVDFDTVPIHTDLEFIPELQVRPRSSTALKTKLRIQVGTVDADYPGQIGVITENTGDQGHFIARGTRIAQLVCGIVLRPEGLRVHNTVRQGGLGSTGK